MKVPFTWLKDYVDIDITPEALSERLFSCGFEVEELIYLGGEADRIVTAKILSIEKHPDADKLQVTQIDAGSYGKFQIVTAAHNIAVGDTVPVALDNSTVYGGGKIKTGKLRGVVSEGMMCSGEELGITEADFPGAGVNGILILPEDTPLGEDIKKIVGTDEYVLDIGVTANRPDCQSVIGIAREVAAVLGKPFKAPATDYTVSAEGSPLSVSVEASDLCPRYMARGVIVNEIAPSPAFIQKRLRLCGLRPISNIVDITNFVLLEMGQPMHAFDRATLEGGKILVRRAEKGEKLVTLDEKENELTEDMLVICDAEKPVALAGIMGGLHSGISDSVTEIVFESAKFKRDCVRKTSKALGLRSDSSARFEKGMDAGNPELGLSRALHLVESLGMGKVTASCADVCSEAYGARTLTVRKADIDGILGLDIPTEDCLRILTSLQMPTEEKDGVLTVTVPAYREDIEGTPDIAEELIRMYGYDHLESTLFACADVVAGGKTQEQLYTDRIKSALSYAGLREIVTYAFVSPAMIAAINLAGEEKYANAVPIVNPLSEDISVMRTSMAPGMLQTVALNLSRKNETVRVFEIGRTFIPKALPLTELPTENETVAMAVTGEGEDFFTLKGVLEYMFEDFGVSAQYQVGGEAFLHPNKSAEIFVGKVKVGVLGEIHPDTARAMDIKKRVYYAELYLKELLPLLLPKTPYRNIPKFPAIARDLALVADKEVTNGSILAVLKKKGGAFLEDVRLFDLYEGDKLPEGKKSLA
ncbi:MAG: phenylalanine--tRNA ligase subunit beta, partial [Clostridia bacterium]|nr:phenylalanine--tRNA ligase subunit beta [Clostridia bacterium]